MRTARPLPYGEVSVGGLSDRDLPWQRPPGQRPCPRQTFPWTKTLLLDKDYPPGQRLHSWTETPLLDRDPPGQRSPRRNMGPVTKTGPGSQTDRKWHQRLPPPVNRMTHASENITLPQTSFAGGKNFPSHIKSFCDICVVCVTAAGNFTVWPSVFPVIPAESGIPSLRTGSAWPYLVVNRILIYSGGLGLPHQQGWGSCSSVLSTLFTSAMVFATSTKC